MDKLEESFFEILENMRDKQGSKRSKLLTDRLEKYVIEKIGEEAEYRELGGYKKFCDQIFKMQETNIISKLAKSESNGKKPRLDKVYWLLPKHNKNYWNDVQITMVSNVLNINFFLKNKKYQTPDEWRKIKIIYELMKLREKRIPIIKEERSLMMFNNERWIKGMEAEKWLNSPDGHTIMNRLKIKPEHLHFKEIREPFIYWQNEDCPLHHKKEVLIVENLATFHTMKFLLNQKTLWRFGPIPHLLIWGAGSRIEGTIDYLQDVVKDPLELSIRYAGDIDYEGFAIYYRLKEKNKHLSLSLAIPIYKFMTEHGLKYKSFITKDQRMTIGNLSKLKTELESYPDIYNVLEKLWHERERVAQEVFNIELLISEGWVTLE
ncbi:Wadjet anti-phage system protein JetD domain-containing protein [Peribacillus frigoritolerans]|uniref:DUF2220 family protein n=1 Tax=Peribacillus castrilensis TaxID=2897690 RepID=A0AAW9NLW9_9BACI|nr:DUF2220 family protein [Peribacillus castrilensis]